MPLPSTMTPIATQTLASAASSVTFSSVPQDYTDLYLVIATTFSLANKSVYLRFNSDSGTNYSYTRLTGDGSTASSARAANSAFTSIGYSSSTTVPMVSFSSIQNYSNSTTYKTMLTRFGDGSTQTQANVALWRSTAAINSIYLYPDSGNFAAGATFTLYGVKAAS